MNMAESMAKSMAKSMADDFRFQSFNFPFSYEQNTSQSFIDYGCSSVANFDLEEEAGKLLLQSRQSHESRLKQQLVANHLTLPFLEPNERSSVLPEDVFSDCQSGNSAQHVDNFSTDYPGIMYGTIFELVNDELNNSHWHGKKCRKVSKDRKLFWGYPERSCKFCATLTKASSRLDNLLDVAIQDIGVALPDIPPKLLEELISESNMLQVPRLRYDTFMGNTLASYSLEMDQLCLLIYPSGQGLDMLNFSHVQKFPRSLEFVNEGEESSLFHPMGARQQFANQGRIQQIDFAPFDSGSIILAIRSQYSCTLFRGSTGNQDGRLMMSLTPMETTAFRKETMCIAVNPYIPGESIVVTNTGGAYLWSCDEALKTICPPKDLCDSNNTPTWYQCVFAGHPRCVAMADSKGVNLLDFRTGAVQERLFFSIPSPHLDSFECISSIQRHPQNTHHYILATDQSLILLDDRFFHHPVLKWRHHNEDPIQFIDVSSGVLPDCDDTVLVIAGSKHRQTHCFQYSSGGIIEDMPLSSNGELSILPPQSTCLPWKVSSYDEWYNVGLHGNLSYSSSAATRLSKPLIGICTMPHTSNQQKGFTVFQMSSVGDLFFQSFVGQGDEDEYKMFEQENAPSFQDTCSRLLGVCREVELSTKANILCQKWMDLVNQPYSFDQGDGQFESYYSQVNKKAFLENLTDFFVDPNPLCVFCNGQAATECELEDRTCERCGVSITFSKALLQNQENKAVATRRSLGTMCNGQNLGIFVDPEKAKDPLSECLWLNWNSEVPIPVALQEENENGSDRSQIPLSVSKEQTSTCKSKQLQEPKPSGTLSIGLKTEDALPLNSNSLLKPAHSHIENTSHNSFSGNSFLVSQEYLASQVIATPVSLPKKKKTPKKKTSHVMGF